VQLQVARRQLEAEARIVLPGDADYPRLLAVMNAVNRNRYDLYLAKTARPIPFVVMSETEAGSFSVSVPAGAR
jgi:hypothetical protein